MVQAVFLDFYGTVVHEDGAIIRIICERISKSGDNSDLSIIGRYWWEEFCNLFANSYGETFRTQRDLEHQSIVNTLKRFHSPESAENICRLMFDRWEKPPIFPEVKEFLQRCLVPVYIVSNIDNADIRKAIEYHGLQPARVFTSENARSYKPRKEIFELALRETGLKPEAVVHIGDSLSSDIGGAKAAGIPAIWLNRTGKPVGEGVIAVADLLQVFNTKYFN